MTELRIVSDKMVDLFLKMVQRNELDRVRTFISNTIDFNVNAFCRSKSGDSALHVASSMGHLEILRFLIEEHSGNIELSNLDGKTPLHNAAQFSRLEIVKYLIQKGANVRAVKKADWTPLMLACTKDNLEVVDVLLAEGADPEFRNKDGWNSLHIAAREGHVPIVSALLNSRNCAPKMCSAQSKNGRTPLHTAVMHGHVAVTEILLGQSVCVDVDSRDSCNSTPLMDACRFGFVKLIELLIDKYGADPFLENSQGLNCLHIGAEAGQLPVISQLVSKYSIEVNRVTRIHGLTPLHFAIRENQLEAIGLLIKLGASRTIPDSHGHTCIDLANVLNKTTVLEIFATEGFIKEAS